MKDYLKKLIARKQAKLEELRKRMKESQDVNEVRSLGDTLESVMEELQEAKAKLEELDKMEDNKDDGVADDTQEDNDGSGKGDDKAARSAFNPNRVLATAEMRNGNVRSADPNDPRASMEYRSAFMAYVQRGVTSDVLQYEARANETGTSANLGVLLPTTVVQEIITGVEKVYGQLYSRVKKTNIKGGVKYPIGSFSASFKRITETTVSDRQNAGGVTGYVEFSYNIGEIRVAQTLLQSILAVPVFERELAKAIIEAYVKAMDKEIMSGDPSKNECSGILTEANKTAGSRIPAANVIEFTEAEMADWTTWQTKLFAKIPISMRSARPEFVMTANTYESNIKTLKDNNNRPLYVETFNPVDGAEICTFKGKPVVLVEDDILKNFNDAANGEYFAMYWVPEKAYAINTNLEFTMIRYMDQETNQWVDKALVINDGKVLDPSCIYLLKKKVTA